MARVPDGATGLLIDGRWCASGTGLTVIDKYTREPFAAVQQARPSDVEAAVTGAAEAARRPLPPARRQEILSEASRLLAARPGAVREGCGPAAGVSPPPPGPPEAPGAG